MTALITGSTAGIGLEFAEYYAKSGYDLIITGTTTKIYQTAIELESPYRINVIPIILKIESISDIDSFLSFISPNRIDVLINNAGFGIFRRHFIDIERNDYYRMIALHNIFILDLTQLVLKKMDECNSGTILNISSAGAILSIPGNSVYAATKAFLIKFTECLFLEIKARNKQIVIACVYPGHSDTPFSGKMGVPEVKQRLFKCLTTESVVRETIAGLNKKEGCNSYGKYWNQVANYP